MKYTKIVYETETINSRLIAKSDLSLFVGVDTESERVIQSILTSVSIRDEYHGLREKKAEFFAFKSAERKMKKLMNLTEKDIRKMTEKQMKSFTLTEREIQAFVRKPEWNTESVKDFTVFDGIVKRKTGKDYRKL